MTFPVNNISLNDGTSIPQLGLGTYRLDDDDAYRVVSDALAMGYRHIDTARIYKNETGVGRAIRESGIPRDDLYITTKLWNGDQPKARDAISSSLDRLGLEHVDLYLIHWPNPSVGRYLDSWKAMIELKDDGLVKNIGVCNFTEENLKHIIDATGVTPTVNQIELHPFFPQAHMLDVHKALGIQTESWSPLGKDDRIREEPVIVELAQARQVTPAQLILRWHIELGTIPLPKSGDPQRQQDNLDIFSFELSDLEVEAISALERGRLWGGDPTTHEEM
jgi:diketogulonate reductase-like aldo/keto reductase